MSLWSDADTDQVVRQFFAEQHRRAAGPAGRARVARIRDQLARFLDQIESPEPIGAEPRVLLELERKYDPTGALLRVFDPIELVQCLPEFVSRDWLLPDRVDAGRQITLTVRLASACRKASGSPFCSCCRHHDVVYVAATVARAVLNQDRAGWQLPDQS